MIEIIIAYNLEILARHTEEKEAGRVFAERIITSVCFFPDNPIVYMYIMY